MNALKVLVTGIEGFTGRYMADALHADGYQVFGITHMPQLNTIAGVETIFSCDLNDAAGVMQVVETVQPDVVVHLAGIAFVAHGDVEAIYRTNVIGSRNLLEALTEVQTRTGQSLRAVLLASSANIYSNAIDGVLDELSIPAPVNDYAVSKLAMEYVAKLYSGRLPIVIVRPFNYTGVGQSENFLLPKIVNHIRRRALVIELGNLHVARDFSDVRMVVQYYLRLLKTPAAIGETFNVCSGRAYTLDEVLTMGQKLGGYDLEVRVIPAFVRKNEVKKLIGSRAKLEAAVGVVPDIALHDTLRWMIEADA